MLEYRNTKLAVVEAKARNEELTLGAAQAKIIGRGTRLYEGKNYFTIYDFVKAHHHFSDPEWDGEPMAEDPCPKCGARPCIVGEIQGVGDQEIAGGCFSAGRESLALDGPA